MDQEHTKERTITVQNIAEGMHSSFKKWILLLTETWDKHIRGVEEIEIPREWINPEMDTIKNSSSVAVEPIIVFEEPVKHRFSLSMPFMLGLKRLLAFILLVACLGSIYWTGRSYPRGLVLTVPSVCIFLDYLMKTHPTEKKVKWYILPDIEEDG